MMRKISVLVVDDSRDRREMLVEYLTFRGFDVIEAWHGADAIEVAQRVRPDIILMDLSMPGIDGWEATRILKANPVTKDTVILAVSAHDFATEQESARASWCDGYIPKPYDLALLADALAAVMSRGARALDWRAVSAQA